MDCEKDPESEMTRSTTDDAAIRLADLMVEDILALEELARVYA